MRTLPPNAAVVVFLSLIAHRSSLAAAMGASSTLCDPGGLKMVRFLLTAGLLMLLAGCVVSEAKDPIPTGKGTYIVTALGPMTGDPLSAAMKRANQFCAESGKVTTMLETTPPRQSGVGPIYVSVQFACTDSEHQQPVQLRPDRGISTDQTAR